MFSIGGSESTPDLCVIAARDHVHRYPAHLHDCVELIWIHAGWAKIGCRGSTYQLKAGDVCLVAPNELHGADVPAAGRCTFTMIHVPSRIYWSLLKDQTRGRRVRSPEPLRILRYQTLGVSFNALIEGFVAAGDDEKRCQLLTGLLDAVMHSPHSFAAVRAEKAFWHPAVVYAREVMVERREETVNLEDIAAEVGLNMRYFITLFKDGTGLSPHQFQIAMRVDKARELLQGIELQLSDIAIDAGFSDQSHFSRHFKRSYGYTPGEFRHSIQPI